MGKGEGKGEGNDGGVIESSRSFVVKEKRAEQKTDTLDNRATRWTTCCLSGETLQFPVVADALGNLFNKEAILSYLVEKRSIPELSHIKRMRDVFSVATTSSSGGAAFFICPISQLQANGSHAFIALRSCGCVLADRALKELLKGDVCPACGKAIGGRDNVVRLVPSMEEADFLRERLKAKRETASSSGARSHAAKTPLNAAAATASAGEPSLRAADSAAAIAAATTSFSSSSSSGSAGLQHIDNHTSAALPIQASDAGHASRSSASAGAKRPRESSSNAEEPSSHKSVRSSTLHHAAPSSSAPLHHLGEGVRSGAAESAQREATQLIEGQKRKSAVYASLFRPQQDESGKGVSKTSRGAHRW